MSTKLDNNNRAIDVDVSDFLEGGYTAMFLKSPSCSTNMVTNDVTFKRPDGSVGKVNICYPGLRFKSIEAPGAYGKSTTGTDGVEKKQYFEKNFTISVDLGKELDSVPAYEYAKRVDEKIFNDCYFLGRNIFKEYCVEKEKKGGKLRLSSFLAEFFENDKNMEIIEHFTGIVGDCDLASKAEFFIHNIYAVNSAGEPIFEDKPTLKSTIIGDKPKSMGTDSKISCTMASIQKAKSEDGKKKSVFHNYRVHAFLGKGDKMREGTLDEFSKQREHGFFSAIDYKAFCEIEFINRDKCLEGLAEYFKENPQAFEHLKSNFVLTSNHYKANIYDSRMHPAVFVRPKDNSNRIDAKGDITITPSMFYQTANNFGLRNVVMKIGIVKVSKPGGFIASSASSMRKRLERRGELKDDSDEEKEETQTSASSKYREREAAKDTKLKEKTVVKSAEPDSTKKSQAGTASASTIDKDSVRKKLDDRLKKVPEKKNDFDSESDGKPKGRRERRQVASVSESDKTESDSD